MKLTWFIIVFICGALLPLQTGFNSRLSKSAASPLYASMICFIVGVLAMALYIPFTKETFNWVGLKSASVFSWIGGGLIGACYITATMLALPRIGMAVTFALVVAGQLCIAVILDHYGVMVTQQHRFNLWRFLGIVFIITGVIIVQKF